MRSQFQGGFSSKSPSTPNRKGKASLFSNPSTTPAGPPPSYLTNASTTPAGPPPRSVYGSSFNAANNTFGRKGNTPGRRGFAVPDSSPPLNEDDEDEDEDEDDEEDADGEVDDEMDDVQQKPPPPRNPALDRSAFMSSIASSPRGLKRSRNGQVLSQVAGDYASIARGVTSHARTAALSESDDVLLREEEVLSRMEAKKDIESAQEAATQLTKLWAKHTKATTKSGTIGPEAKDGLSKANYLSSLLLQLHHPHRLKSSSQPRTQGSFTLTTQDPSDACPVPRALLDWLETYHKPFPDLYPTVSSTQPAPSAHECYWDSVYASLTRGKFQHVINLLRNAGWENAYTAEEDSQPEGYTDKQLDNIEEVAERAARLLESCPVIRYDDWDVKGADWTVFRRRVQQTLRDLERFAGEKDEEDEDAPLVPTRGENVFSMSAASKRAESKVPWTVYSNLKLCYVMLLGSPDEILDASQDWLEASIYMTVWWDGENTGADLVDLNKSSLRKSMAASQQKTREVDVTPAAAYRRRLADAFAYVTGAEEAIFTPETMDPVQVSLGCVLTDNVESAIGMLRTWSLPVTVAVVEVAALAGWLSQTRPRSRGFLEQAGFSSEDLMVLSHGPGWQRPPPAGEVRRDDVLSEYADLLAEKGILRSSDGRLEREGWELAVAVLGRMDDDRAAEKKVGELLGDIDLTDEARVDKVLRACLELDLTEHARAIAERYADTLADSTQAYGSALIYYARAHATEKLKDTLGLLTSLSLLHSSSVPAQADLDTQLSSLLSSDRTALVQLARIDTDAATLLASHLSGYATLRRFYDLRDQDVSPSSSVDKSTLRPLERRREAARSLTAVLVSAADCIRGGLYDPEIESVVPVDGVLALLGEALPLLGREKRTFSKEQVFTLLRVVEDFCAAPSRIRENAGSLLRASVHAYHNNGAASPQTLSKSRSDLSKSSSGGLGGSSWDLLAESVMMQSAESSRSNGKKSAVGMGNVTRGWDWRKGLESFEGGQEVGTEQVLVLVRTALAQEVGRGWSRAINW